MDSVLIAALVAMMVYAKQFKHDYSEPADIDTVIGCCGVVLGIVVVLGALGGGVS